MFVNINLEIHSMCLIERRREKLSTKYMDHASVSCNILSEQKYFGQKGIQANQQKRMVKTGIMATGKHTHTHFHNRDKCDQIKSTACILNRTVAPFE